MFACMYVYKYMIYLCLFELQNAAFKKTNGFVEISTPFPISLFTEDLMLLARSTATLTMHLQPGNEPTSPSTYLQFSLLVLLANCTNIPPSLSF